MLYYLYLYLSVTLQLIIFLRAWKTIFAKGRRLPLSYFAFDRLQGCHR